MRERELRQRCRELLNELDIRPPLDVHELCRRVGAQQGRPVRPVAHPIPVPGPFGAWIATGTVDYILYQRETSRPHQDHIVLHELGHILAGHRGAVDDDALSESVPAHRFPDLTQEAVRRALRRTSYDSEHEREAETVATIILEWASVLESVGAPPVSPGAAAQRMGRTLTARLGWL